MNKRLILLLLAAAGLVSATGFGPARGFEDYADSVRSLPPRMRPFFSEDYRQQVFNAPRPDSLNVRCVGRWPWGPSYEVTAQRDTLYLASGSGVRIVDITTPTNPRHIGQVCAKGLVSQVVIRESLLYVASQGLEIFNVSNPATPTRRSWLNIPVSDFGLKDSFAVCISDSLRIVNVRDAGNPVRVGASPDSGWSIFVAGNYAYTGSRWELAIINITNPLSPRRAGARGAYVHALWVQGNHCYTATGDQGFTVFNVRDSSSIWEEGRIGNLWSYDVHVIGNFAYTPNFAVVDISDSSSPAVVGSVNMPCGPLGVWVKSPFSRGFVADAYEGLASVDISDPTRPRVDTVCFGASSANDVVVRGGRASIADDHAGLRILDVSDVSSPFEIGRYDTVGQEPQLYTLWAADTLIYLGDDLSRLPPRFAVVNVKEPSLIRRLGSCVIPSSWSEDMYLKQGDSVVYTANESYLCGFNVRNPGIVTLVCSLRVGADEVYGVYARDTLVYLNGSLGLKVISISNPARPAMVSRCTTQTGRRGIVVKDSLAFLATNYVGLFIVNVADPRAPFVVDSFVTRYDGAQDVWIDDTLAFVADLRTLQIVSIRDPRNVVEVGYYAQVPYSISRLFYDGRYIYGTLYDAGLAIFERLGTGIEEETRTNVVNSGLTFRPNPTRSRIFCSLPLNMRTMGLKIYDVGGREMTATSIGARDCGSGSEIDLDGLNPGVYFIILKDGSKRIVSKIVKL